jgi:ABC-type multidrug transport system ATPase subunit
VTHIVLSAVGLAAGYGRRQVFRDVTFQVPAGQAMGVIGPSGAGKTTLLRIVVGLLAPVDGDVRLNGLPPRDALTQTAVAYFAGEATLPGTVRAAAWGRLAHGSLTFGERRRIRTLSRGTRQLLGLRTVLGRQVLDLVVLDEPWESLDSDGGRWLTATLESKRERGAALLLASHRLEDLAGSCDAYLFLLPHQAIYLRAHEISPACRVTPQRLAELLESLRGRTSTGEIRHASVS